MADNDKKLINENVKGRWAKLANIKSALQSGVLSEGRSTTVTVTENEDEETRAAMDDMKKGVSSAVKTVTGETTDEGLKEELGDLEDEEVLDDLGDEAPEEEGGLDLDATADESTVMDLVQAIGRAINDEVGEEVVDVSSGDEGEELADLGDEGDIDDLDLGDEDELMEKKTTKESLVREQTKVVRNAIISEVARRVRVRAQRETQKQKLAESLADRIFNKLRNKK